MAHLTNYTSAEDIVSYLHNILTGQGIDGWSVSAVRGNDAATENAEAGLETTYGDDFADDESDIFQTRELPDNWGCPPCP